MDMALKRWVWISKDGYGVERIDMELKRLGMEFKGWIWG